MYNMDDGDERRCLGTGDRIFYMQPLYKNVLKMKCSFDQQRHNSIANLHETQINMLTALIPKMYFPKPCTRIFMTNMELILTNPYVIPI